VEKWLSLWAKTKNETTAHFGATSYMYSSVEPRPIINSIWATKDTLRLAPEFKGGIGEHLLKKMGWTPGQGLGRKMDGPVEPLTLDVKSDRKGLFSSKDKHPPRREHAAVMAVFSGNKNPVSTVMEYCAKNGIPPPLFMPTEEGLSNNRRFGCKAILNGVEYDTATGATNKKAAKSQVCLIICQALNLC